MHEDSHILLRGEYAEYPDDIVSILLDAADASGVAPALMMLLRTAAATIDDLRNGRGG